MNDRLSKVRQALTDYEHPLLEFSAHDAGSSVEVHITLKPRVDGLEPYVFSVHPRDIDHPQFKWNFQRQLYDSLHDYVIEMFSRNPQMEDY